MTVEERRHKAANILLGYIAMLMVKVGNGWTKDNVADIDHLMELVIPDDQQANPTHSPVVVTVQTHDHRVLQWCDTEALNHQSGRDRDAYIIWYLKKTINYQIEARDIKDVLITFPEFNGVNILF